MKESPACLDQWRVVTWEPLSRRRRRRKSGGRRIEKATKSRWIKNIGHGSEDENTKTGRNFLKMLVVSSSLVDCAGMWYHNGWNAFKSSEDNQQITKWRQTWSHMRLFTDALTSHKCALKCIHAVIFLNIHLSITLKHKNIPACNCGIQYFLIWIRKIVVI